MTRHAILTPEEHRELRIRPDRGVALGDAVMSSLVTPDEFRRAQGCYPILFRLNQETGDFAALAMFGFETGENLFLQDDRWDAPYLPLAIDIQPFLIGGSADDSGPKQVHVDLGSPRIAGNGGEGVRVFDEFGRPSPYLDAAVEKLGALDESYRASPSFFAALRRYDLLEPFTLEVELEDGSTNRLVGFHVIDEERVRTLDAAALGDLHGQGHLLPIFMAMASLSNIGDLVARKNRSMGIGRG